MRFAIAIPQVYPDGEFDPGAFRAYFAARRGAGLRERLDAGVDARHEPAAQPAGGDDATRPPAPSGCGWAASVFVSTLHSPVHLAKSIASLDQLSRGRIEVGVGTGGPGRPFAAFGVDPARYVGPVHRGRRADEGAVDRAEGHLRRPVLAAGERADGAEAVPEAVPAAVVRRGQRARAAARRAHGLRLLRRGLDDHGEVRRAGPDRHGRCAGRSGPGRRGLPHRQARLHRGRRGRRAGPGAG